LGVRDGELLEDPSLGIGDPHVVGVSADIYRYPDGGPIGAPPGGGYSSRPSRLPRRATAPMGQHHSGGRPWMK
jgi:hypothetical protein